jgi:PilZ domain
LNGASFSQPPDAGTRFAERRAAPRYPFVAPAELFEPIARLRLSGRTSQLSLGGCYVDVQDPLPVKTVCQLRIEWDRGKFETWARIVYIHPGAGMGIAFFDTSPEQKATLADWLAEPSALPVS